MSHLDFTNDGFTPAQSDTLNEIDLAKKLWIWDDWNSSDNVVFSGMHGSAYVSGKIDRNGHIHAVLISR